MVPKQLPAKWPLAARISLLLVILLLFFFACRPAYKGYFHSDDLDTMSWTKNVRHVSYAHEMFNLAFSKHNARPTVHFLYYKLLDDLAPYRFPVWLAVLQAIHLLNVVLVWLLLGRFGVSDLSRGLGAAVFAFHPAAFDAYFKPMFAYDVMCTTFVLLALLTYTRRWWVLALVCMFFAYRAKELAIVLPAVLLAWEWWLGDRKLWRVVPFFALSLNFGIQAMLFNRTAPDTPYKLRFTLEALLATLPFYMHKMLGPAWGGLLTLVAAAVWREKRVWWSVVAIWAPLGILLFLPGRMFWVYLYLSLIGFAVLSAVLLEKLDWRVATAVTVVWLGMAYTRMPAYRSEALEAGKQARIYTQAAAAFSRANPDIQTVLYENMALGLADPDGIVHYFANPEARTAWVGHDASRAHWKGGAGLLSWEPVSQRLFTRVLAKDPPSHFFVGSVSPLEHLTKGWVSNLGRCWYTLPEAEFQVSQPPGPSELFLTVMPHPGKTAGTKVELEYNGTVLEPMTFDHVGLQTKSWNGPQGPGLRTVRLRVTPPIRVEGLRGDLGVCVAGAGFLVR